MAEYTEDKGPMIREAFPGYGVIKLKRMPRVVGTLKGNLAKCLKKKEPQIHFRRVFSILTVNITNTSVL